MDRIEIRRMSPNDIGAACKVLGLAFADNPNTLVVARGDRARAQRMTESGARFAKLGRRYSHVLVAEDKGLGLPRAFKMMSVWAKHDPVSDIGTWGRSVCTSGSRIKASGRRCRQRSWTWPMSRAHLPIWRPMSTGTWHCMGGSVSR